MVLALAAVEQVIAEGTITQPPTPTRSFVWISTLPTNSLFASESFCFEKGSICEYASQLSFDCRFSEGEEDLSDWYRCQCESGSVAVNQQ